MILRRSQTSPNQANHGFSWSFSRLLRRSVQKAKSLFGFASEPIQIGPGDPPGSDFEGEPDLAGSYGAIESSADKKVGAGSAVRLVGVEELPSPSVHLARAQQVAAHIESDVARSHHGDAEKDGDELCRTQLVRFEAVTNSAATSLNAPMLTPDGRPADQAKKLSVSFEDFEQNALAIRPEVRLADTSPYNDVLRSINQNCKAVIAGIVPRKLRGRPSTPSRHDG